MAEAAEDIECISLSKVSSREQTHAVQPWYHADILDMVSARLKASWRDQGWGNRKGAIHARVATPDGTALHPWRRIGPYPAPHDETEVDIEIPIGFFSGEVPLLVLSVWEGSGHNIRIPADSPQDLVATATYGHEDRSADVTEIVKQELAAGRSVTASNRLFGDPCPGFGKLLTVTIGEHAEVQKTGPMPADARLELGFEVGGGGGHSLHIDKASLFPERRRKVFTATFMPPEIVITTLSGEKFATISDVTVEETEEARADKIRTAVREVLGPGIGFQVIMSDTNQMIPG